MSGYSARMRRIKTAGCSFLLVFSLVARLAAGENAALDEAIKQYGLGHTQQALDICISALDKNPLDQSVYAYTLEILPEGRTNYGKSFKNITTKALASGQAAGIYYLGLCKLYRGTGQLKEALANCKKAKALDPASWHAYRELGLTYSKSGDTARAVETLTHGAGLAPDNYKLYYYLAVENERGKDVAAAVKNYRKALALSSASKDFDAYLYSRLIRGKMRRLGTAPRQGAAARKLEPSKTRVSPPVKPAAPKQSFESCMLEAGELIKSGDLSALEKKLETCAELNPGEPQVRVNRAGLLVTLGRYEEAIEQYQKAAGLLPAGAPLAAICHLKTAQVYSRLNNQPRTIEYYVKALEINKNDITAEMELAAVYEAAAEPRKAEALYDRVVLAQPDNTRARERLEEIRFSLLSPASLLEELRVRGAADAKKTAPSMEDLDLLKTMRLAERNGAVDYLHSKTAYTKGLIVEQQDQGKIKLMLTQAGLTKYQTLLSRDTVAFFEKKAIRLQDVFTLRDLKGRPVFEKNGRLTTEGMKAYWQARAGIKSWLMVYESVPRQQTPEEEKMKAEISALMKNGYREISEPEYLWLMKATTCPDDVLRNSPCNIQMLTAQNTRKYFLCFFEGVVCYTRESLVLAGYVLKYRENETWVPDEGKSTAFFGSGGVEKRRFCHQNKLWNGN